MSTTPSAPKPAGDPRAANSAEQPAVEPHFGDQLHAFWEKNSSLVLIALAAVLLGILAKGGWEYLQEQREKEIEKTYAAASTSAQLKTFATSHTRHPLAGAAWLRIADEAYAASRYADAVAPYEDAAATLKTGPLASRARLGAAISKLQSGRTADGEAALKAFAAEAKEPKAFRAEAAYHLAAEAFANKQPENVKTYAEQVLQIDPTSPWAQRAMSFRAQLPAGSDTGIKLPAPGAK